MTVQEVSPILPIYYSGPASTGHLFHRLVPYSHCSISSHVPVLTWQSSGTRAPDGSWRLSHLTPIVLRRRRLSPCGAQFSQTADHRPERNSRTTAEESPGRSRARSPKHGLPSSANTGIIAGPKRSTIFPRPPLLLLTPPLRETNKNKQLL